MSQGPQLEPVHLRQPVVRVARWTWRMALAALLVGALSAGAAACVRLSFRGLQWLLTGSGEDPPMAAAALSSWRRALTPVLGAALATLVLWVQRRRAQKAGREVPPYIEYVEAVRHRHGVIPLAPNCWRTLSAAFSVASGAAVGREGSMIQFAASIASICSRWRGWLDQNEDAQLSLLVACGVAGGVTTAYNAPLAAVFFAAEIVMGGLAWLDLVYLGLAAAAGYGISGSLLGWERLYPTPVHLCWSWRLCLLPVLAIAAGLAGPAYQWLLGSLRAARRLPLALPWSGAVVGGLSVIDPRVWGNGDVGLRAALGHGSTLGAASITSVAQVLSLRLIATLACVSTGTVGGVFTPTLFAGAAAAALASHGLPGSPAALWALAGMSFFMAAVTQAPLMSACIVVELTGNWALLPLLVPLNFGSWWIAKSLSPRAMYAIASEAPVHDGGEPAPSQGDDTVARDGSQRN